jgi:hypothetical protein
VLVHTTIIVAVRMKPYSFDGRMASVMRRTGGWLALTALGACLGVACVPVRVWAVPEVKGRIRRGVVPVPNATVVWMTWEYQDDKRAAREAARALTNAHGQFEMKAASRLTWVVLLPAHSIAEWEVILQEGEHRTVLWRQWLYSAGPRSTPARVALDCNTELPRPCDLLEVEGSRLQPQQGLPVAPTR